MVKGFTRLVVRADTRALLMGKCKEEFLKHKPHFKELNLTQDILIKEICRFYLRI